MIAASNDWNDLTVWQGVSPRPILVHPSTLVEVPNRRDVGEPY
jgi:hypothetical protein